MDRVDQPSGENHPPSPESEFPPSPVLLQGPSTPSRKIRQDPPARGKKKLLFVLALLLLLLGVGLGVSFPRTASGREKWSYQTGKIIWSSPVVANGILYVGAFDRKVYALDVLMGQEKWSSQTGDQAGDLIVASPTVVNDIVYVGSYNGKLHAFDAVSGHEKWFFQLEGERDYIQSSPVVVGGIVYVSANNGRLYAVQSS